MEILCVLVTSGMTFEVWDISDFGVASDCRSIEKILIKFGVEISDRISFTVSVKTIKNAQKMRSLHKVIIITKKLGGPPPYPRIAQ